MTEIKGSCDDIRNKMKDRGVCIVLVPEDVGQVHETVLSTFYGRHIYIQDRRL